jgi:hypothetical protein
MAGTEVSSSPRGVEFIAGVALRQSVATFFRWWETPQKN